MKVRWVVRRSHQMFGSRYSSVSRRSSNVMLSASLQVGITKHTLGPAVLAPAVRPRQCLPRHCLPRQCLSRHCLSRQCLSRQCLPRQCLPRNCPGAKQSSVSVPRSMSISFALRSRRRPVCEADPRIRGRRGGRSHRAGPWSTAAESWTRIGAWSSHSRTGARHSTLNPPPARREPPHEPLPPPAPSLPHRGAYPVHQLHNSLTPVERARKVAAVWR